MSDIRSFNAAIFSLISNLSWSLQINPHALARGITLALITVLSPVGHEIWGLRAVPFADFAGAVSPGECK